MSSARNARIWAIPIGLAALATLAVAPAVATAPPPAAGAAMPAPKTTTAAASTAPTIAEQPLNAATISPVVADLRSTPGLAAAVVSRTIYYAGVTPATLNVTNTGASAVALNVTLVRTADSTVVRRWTTAPVAPAATQAVIWDGTIDRTAPARTAKFQFQVWPSAASGTGVAAPLAPTPALADTVEVRPDAYPLNGRHDYGIGGNGRFGTGRSGHMHQGQDIFAACGTPVLAARGGTVQFAEFQSSAGNYVVLDGDGTAQDTAYMHLRDPALPATGEHVGTGQLIGYVGDTGDASECHLHFELWDAPGWYEGGQPIDPMPSLESWDD